MFKISRIQPCDIIINSYVRNLSQKAKPLNRPGFVTIMPDGKVYIKVKKQNFEIFEVF